MLETAAKKKTDPHHIIEDYPIGHIGDFGRSIGTYFSDFMDNLDPASDHHWHFKVCFDEAECLSSFQRLVINSSVRLSKSHVFYVISYVDSLVDITSTLIPNMTLQRADRELINLDLMTDDIFKNLAEGVSNVRIKKLDASCSDFDIESILGKLDINSLLKGILNTSESITAKELLGKSIKLSRKPFYKTFECEDVESTATDSKESPPIYQAYIIDSLGLKLPSKSDPKWKDRAQKSREIRKKMVAAYLCICKELNKDVRYAFAEMVLQMSDKCIRDFLLQVDAIYRETGLKLCEFITTKVSISKQDAAIRNASQSKKDSIGQSGVTAPLEITRIIDGLGQITATLQSGSRNKALSSSERGNFVINIKNNDLDKYSNSFGSIQEACEAGFLKIIESSGRKWKFRVQN